MVRVVIKNAIPRSRVHKGNGINEWIELPDSLLNSFKDPPIDKYENRE